MLKPMKPLVAALAVAVASAAFTGPASAMGEPKSNQFWWPEQLDLEPAAPARQRVQPDG